MEHKVDENGYIIEPEELNQEYESSFFLMITQDVLLDKRLTDFQRMLFAAITGLCRKNGYCWASNSYFEKMFDKSTDTIIKGITKLVNLGYLQRELVYKKKQMDDGNIMETKEVSFRKLYVVINSTGSIKNNTGGSIKNNTEIDNPIIDNPTSINIFSKENNLLEDNTETVVYIGEDNINNLDTKNKVLDDMIFSKPEGTASIPKTPAAPTPKKKGGLAPLYDMVDEKYPAPEHMTVNLGLKSYLKAHLGIRRLPSIEKWNDMLNRLERYSAITLPGTIGTKFVDARAIEILDKAITGKDGVPYPDFDDIYHPKELKEPTFELNRDFTKGY